MDTFDTPLPTPDDGLYVVGLDDEARAQLKAWAFTSWLFGRSFESLDPGALDVVVAKRQQLIAQWREQDAHWHAIPDRDKAAICSTTMLLIGVIIDDLILKALPQIDPSLIPRIFESAVARIAKAREAGVYQGDVQTNVEIWEQLNVVSSLLVAALIHYADVLRQAAVDDDHPSSERR